MITYKAACKIAREQCSLPYVTVYDIADRWSFVFSCFAPEEHRNMYPPPAYFVFKEDGHVEWYTVPPFENLDLLESGKKIDFIE